MMIPRFHPFHELKKLTDHLAARVQSDMEKDLTRGESIGVIFILVTAALGLLKIALSRYPSFFLRLSFP